MKRSTSEILAASTALTLLYGATACGHAQQANDTSSKLAAHNTLTTGFVNEAKEIVSIAKASTTKTTEKPPYTIGFSRTLRGGGKLEVAVQTADTSYDANRTKALFISQTLLAGQEANDVRSFSVDIDVTSKGKWDVFCNDDVGLIIPPKAEKTGGGISETDEQTLYLGAKEEVKSHSRAEAVTHDVQANINGLLFNIGSTPSSEAFPVLQDLCAINIGDLQK